eukprot:TRINITY_DN99_c0_g2_i1.p1 TRINITY_DN99_c0_g2~~TRINITY_DN99_c0_g2_i1.p1  ORF type:complete len:171 (-),score=84.07 TRINITY_DN99_c0_g2_i1:101-613(-)
MANIVKQNFSDACEKGLNDQIHAELSASYQYLAMAAYFQRYDVALDGFHAYFKAASDEEKEHAEEFMAYQNKRGGRVDLTPLDAPKMEWETPLEALEDALALERTVNQKILDLHAIADESNDPQMQDFLEGTFLNEQVDAIKELGDKITNYKRCGDGLGVYLFDKNTMSS